MFTNLISPTQKQADALQQLGIIQNGHNLLIDESTGKMKSFADVQSILHDKFAGLTDVQRMAYAQAIFGQYALAGSSIMANVGADAFGNLKEKIEGVSAQQAAASMLDTFSGHMQQLSAHVQTTAKEFGMSFLPILNALLPIGNSILDWFQQLTPQTKTLLMGFLGVGSAVAILGGALAGLGVTLKFAGEGFEALKGLFMIENEAGAMVSIFSKMAAAIRDVGFAEAFMDAMSPEGWIVLAVAAIAGLAIVITQHWTAIKNFLLPFWTPIQQATTAAFNAIRNVIEAAMNYIAPFINAINIRIHEQWYDIWHAIDSLFGDVFRDIRQALSDAMRFIENTIFGGTGNIRANWTQVWNNIAGVAKTVFNAISTTVMAAIEYIGPTIVSGIEKVHAFWNSVWPEIKQLFVEVWNVMKVVLAPILAALYVIISGALGALKAMWVPFWTLVKDIFKSAWDLIVDALRYAFDVITGIFKIALDLLTGNWSKAWDDIKQLGNKSWSDLQKFFGDLAGDLFKIGGDIVNGIAKGIEGAIGGIVAAAQKVWNAVKNVFGGGGSQVAPPAGDAVKQMASSVPKFAQGGVVSQPTLAMVGEGGEREFIIPESKLAQQGGYQIGLPNSFSMPGGSRSGIGGFVVNIQPGAIQVNGSNMTPDAVASAIMSKLRQKVSYAI